jgi:hypothetical protein
VSLLAKFIQGEVAYGEDKVSKVVEEEEGVTPTLLLKLVTVKREGLVPVKEFDGTREIEAKGERTGRGRGKGKKRSERARKVQSEIKYSYGLARRMSVIS